MDLRKQKHWLYAFSFSSCLRITDAVWVVLLVARGFALWQVGLAEGVYHITSLLGEVPSGMAADLLGRRRSLVLSGLLGAASALGMAFCPGFAGVCLAMALSALAGSLISGTQQALAYDSLVQAGCPQGYLALTANCNQLENAATVLGTLAAFLAAVLSYVQFYLLDALICLGRTGCALALAEPTVTTGQTARLAHPFARLGRRFRAHVSATAGFLLANPPVALLFLADACVSLPGFLLMMFLPQHLLAQGHGTAWLALSVLLMGAGRMAGTAVGRCLRPRRLSRLCAGCGLLIGLGTACAGLAGQLWLAVGGAMLAAAAMDVWLLHLDKRLNDAFPSDQRATLVSVDSMTYSLLMIAASPLVGWLSDVTGNTGTGLAALGAAVAAAALAVGLLAARRRPRAA